MKKESNRRKAILKEIGEKKKLGYAALASLKKAANRLNNRMNSIKETPLKHKTGSSFADYRGRLAMPVKGKIISRFGTERNSNYTAFTFQSGIDIKAERGEPVRSVFKGRVIFAQWLKGYGNMVIIDHGDNYYTLYAHVDEIFKKKGSLINTGEVIATAGDTGSLKGTCLHFEVRFHGKPVNPVKWLKKGA
jgi:septal ring factor EnvC (AmiA/AmiB activator)